MRVSLELFAGISEEYYSNGYPTRRERFDGKVEENADVLE